MARIRTRKLTRVNKGARGQADSDVSATPAAHQTAGSTSQNGGDGSGADRADGTPGATPEATEDLAGLRSEERHGDVADDAGDVEYVLDDATTDDDGFEPLTSVETPEQRKRRIMLDNLAKGRQKRHAGKRGPGRPRTRPPASDDEPSPTRARKEQYRLDRQAVGKLLDIIDSLTASQLGERAKFNRQERDLIEPSLFDILQKMTPRSAALFGNFAAPIMLGTGLFLWGTRVFTTPSRPVERPRLLHTEPPATARPEPSMTVEPTAPPAVESDSTGTLRADIRQAWEG